MSKLNGRLSSAITVPGQDLPMTCVPRNKGGATGGHRATLPGCLPRPAGNGRENDRTTTNRKPRSGIPTTVSAVSHSVSVNSYHQYYLTDLILQRWTSTQLCLSQVSIFGTARLHLYTLLCFHFAGLHPAHCNLYHIGPLFLQLLAAHRRSGARVQKKLLQSFNPNIHFWPWRLIPSTTSGSPRHLLNHHAPAPIFITTRPLGIAASPGPCVCGNSASCLISTSPASVTGSSVRPRQNGLSGDSARPLSAP